MNRQVNRDVSQAARVIEGYRENLGLLQICLSAPQVASCVKRREQGEPEIDGLLARVTRLRQKRESMKRLLEIPYLLVVRRPRHGLVPRLPAVQERLVPHCAR